MNHPEAPVNQALAATGVILSWSLLPTTLACVASALAIVYYCILIYRLIRTPK